MRALDDPSVHIRRIATNNRRATELVLLKALDDRSEHVRLRAVGNDGATERVLLKALNDSSERVRERAVVHPRSNHRVRAVAVERAPSNRMYRALDVGLDHEDPHDALRIACRYPDSLSKVSHGAIAAVAGSARAVTEFGLHLDPGSRPKTWDELPGLRDVEFKLCHEAQRLEGKLFAGLPAELIRTGRDLKALGNRMDNCIDGYFYRCLEGETVVVSFDDPGRGEVYAAAWDVTNHGLAFIEANSIANDEAVPLELKRPVVNPLGAPEKPSMELGVLVTEKA